MASSRATCSQLSLSTVLFRLLFLLVYEIAPIEARSIFLTFHQIMITVGNLTAFLISLPLLYQKHVLLSEVDSRWWNVVFALPVACSCFILLIFTYIYPLDSPLFYYIIQDQRAVSAHHLSLRNLSLICFRRGNSIERLNEQWTSNANPIAEYSLVRHTALSTISAQLQQSQASL